MILGPLFCLHLVMEGLLLVLDFVLGLFEFSRLLVSLGFEGFELLISGFHR